MGNITTDFITATKKIHADVRAVLAALHLIGNDLKLIREHSVDNADAQKSTNQASNSSPQPTDKMTGRVHALNASDTYREEENRTDDKETGFHKFKGSWIKNLKKPRIQIEIAALIGLGLYTCETRRTNDLVRDQQRPYIFTEPSHNPANVPLQVGKQLEFEIAIFNAGDSPAVNIRHNATNIDMGGRDVEEKVRRCDIDYPKPSIKMTALPPHQGGSTTKQMALLPYVSIVIPDQAQLDRLLTRDSKGFFVGDHIFIWGGIKYNGFRGGDYLTEYCYIYLPDGAPFEKCSQACTNMK